VDGRVWVRRGSRNTHTHSSENNFATTHCTLKTHTSTRERERKRKNTKENVTHTPMYIAYILNHTNSLHFRMQCHSRPCTENNSHKYLKKEMKKKRSCKMNQIRRRVISFHFTHRRNCCCHPRARHQRILGRADWNTEAVCEDLSMPRFPDDS